MRDGGSRIGPTQKKVKKYAEVSPKVLGLIQKVGTFRALEM